MLRITALALAGVALMGMTPAGSPPAVECLTLNIYHEARGEPPAGQRMVAHVTMNRVASSAYPATVCEVVYQRKQFSWTHDGKSDRPRDKRAYARARAIAVDVMRERSMTDYPLSNITHYHADHVRPYWAKVLRPVLRRGNHVFYQG